MIPSELKQTVCFLGFVDDYGKEQFCGTGFFVDIVDEQDPELGYQYLVTARHCVEKCKERSTPIIRTNQQDGRSVTHALPNNWFFPDTADDIAVHQVVLPVQAENLTFGDHMLARYADLEDISGGLGTELISVGLFPYMPGQVRNTPIVRTGIIAAMPDEPLVDDNGLNFVAYLVEVRSAGGSSGSPVLVRYRPNDRVSMLDQRVGGEQYRYNLVGLIRGHVDIAADGHLDFEGGKRALMNAGLAIVTPADAILDLIFSDVCKEARNHECAVLQPATT